MASQQKIIEQKTTELINLLGLGEEAAVTVAPTERGLAVVIDGDNLGVLIGYHGETLASLQHLLGMIIYREVGEWVPVTVDVSGYRQSRQDKLTEIAKAAADRVRFLQKEIELVPMSAWERRIIHLAVGEAGGVASESIGEGYSRRVVIKPQG